MTGAPIQVIAATPLKLGLLFVLLLGLGSLAYADGYDDGLVKANAAFKAGKTADALTLTEAMQKSVPNRYEAFALSALVLAQAGRVDEAKAAIDNASKRAPAEKQARVREIAQLIAAHAGADATTLSGTERRRYNGLLVIIDEADAAKNPAERSKLLAEFLEKSAAFVQDHPQLLQVWTLRAVAAIELNRAKVAWESGQQMTQLGADNSDDPKVGKVLAMLDRKGWSGAQLPAVGPKPGEKWENSLGMKFVPVPGTNVLFSIWETRVQDFDAFVKEMGYKGDENESWRSPGFAQTALHPVCCVNWNDATEFCRWLTKREKATGNLEPNQEYRLPTDAEWSAAVGLPDERGSTPEEKNNHGFGGGYPWGTQWPPPIGAGNYAGEGDYVDAGWKIDGYADGAQRTAKVGSYTVNRFGIYDLGGNVWEWCEDWYDNDRKTRVLRGASFEDCIAAVLLSSTRFFGAPGDRVKIRRHSPGDGTWTGFRCVVAVGASSL